MSLREILIKSTGELTAVRLTAPWHGQHSDEVVRGLGYSGEDVARLFEAGVIFDRYRESP